jgi:glycosyltransferase involved in cell wall biosynthesis
MLISIITPVLNGARTIDRTLQALSVQKANFEHIVMDGGSKDATESIVRGYEAKYPVKWHSQPDRSLYEGLWNGSMRAKGDVMGMINADDFYLPWTLAIVQRVFQENPNVDWITGIPGWYFEESGLQFTASYAPVYFRKLIKAGWHNSNRLGFLQQESMFWRRRLWDDSKAEIEQTFQKYKYASDYHLWRLFAARAELRTVSSTLACFSISENQLSNKFKERYLAECGIKTESTRMRLCWHMFNRCAAYAFFRRVIKPVSQWR